MKKYKVIFEYYGIPVGTILYLDQVNVGYEDLVPYWAYVYAYYDSVGNFHCGELQKRDVEENTSYFELINNEIY